MKPSVVPLGIVTLSIFGFLIILTLFTNTGELVLDARQMHHKVIDSQYTVYDSLLHVLDDPILIDIRDSKNYSLMRDGSAVNIPLPVILDERHASIFESDRPKVIFSDDPVKAHGAWMLLTQLGYESLFVAKISEYKTP